MEGRPKKSNEKCRPLVGGIDRGFPHTPAVLRLPTSLLAGGGEVLGGDFAGFVGLGVADFVEVHHNFYLLVISFLYLNYSIACSVCQALFFI